jgi:hypothetical protein
LANNVICGIEADLEGNLWTSTNKGLSKFDPRAETFHNHDVRDGLQDNEFNVGAHFASPSGELFFGGIRGFNAFHPEQVTGNPHVPPVVITIFGKFNQVVRRDLEPGEHIALTYRDNLVSFEFAALDYTAPDKNHYAYMLEGQEESWVGAGTRRHVDYTNLRVGDYVFRVKGSNNDGVWNEDGAVVTLTVTPPFWETWWFRGGAILLLAEVRELTRGALAEMRTLLLELRPSALADAELGDLLRQLAEATTGRARVLVDVQIEGEYSYGCTSSAMPPDVKVALYRIAQEALNNVAKHSGAGQATVRLCCGPERVALHVADNGRGFDVDAIPPDHLGVGIMRERSEAIRATLTIESEIGQGTDVTVVWDSAPG